ncbi:MAG: 5-formyltetrahydrofolate cyclo-ligase [Nitrososphaerales archaeon]
MNNDIRDEKSRIRQAVWRDLEESGVARFPRPVYHRIPNFQGAEEAASRLFGLSWFRDASYVKVNPDSPQRMVRFHTLAEGKILLTPTPRLREGFLLLKSEALPERMLREASTIRGMFRFGRPVGLEELPKIDLIVVGSVAVSPDGGRLGKGEGYGEIEYALLREMKRVNDKTPIVTTVHDNQIVTKIPVEEHDVPVDIIVTPKRIIETETKHRKPAGIVWRLIDERRMNEMPILKTLKERTSR